MSAADLLAVLVGRHLRYDWDEPGNPGNDHLIFSKGHASPLLYSVFKAVGVVSDDCAARPRAQRHSAGIRPGVIPSAAFRGVLVAPAGGLGCVRAGGYGGDREQPAATG